MSFNHRVQRDESSYWPGDGPVSIIELATPDSPLARGLIAETGFAENVGVVPPEWRLVMYQSGHLAIKRLGEDDDGAISVAWSEELEPLKKAFVFCKMGYDQDRDPTWNWQNGTPYIFNWVTGTLYQVSLAQRILALFLMGRVNEAWDTGKMAEDLVRMAEENERRVREGSDEPLLSHDDPRVLTQRQRHIRHLPECPTYDDADEECRCDDLSPGWTSD